MTDPASSIALETSAAHMALQLWSASSDCLSRLADGLGVSPPRIGSAVDLPDGWRMIGVEPNTWWLIGSLAERFDRVAALGDLIGGDGAATDMTGSFVRLRISGQRWKTLLMVGGVFDAESPAFSIGAVAGTLLHHVSVRYDVVAEDAVAVYVAPSYAEHLLHHLHAAAAMLEALEPEG